MTFPYRVQRWYSLGGWVMVTYHSAKSECLDALSSQRKKNRKATLRAIWYDADGLPVRIDQ